MIKDKDLKFKENKQKIKILKNEIETLKEENEEQKELINVLRKSLDLDILISNLMTGLNKYMNHNELLINELLKEKNNSVKSKAKRLYKYFLSKFSKCENYE